MTKLSRQAALVRDHLFTRGSLSSWEAEGVYRIRRLASRVSELKNAGYGIEKTRSTDATGQPYTRYAFSKTQLRTRKPVNVAVKSTRRFTLEELRSGYADYGVKQNFFDDQEDAAPEANDFVAFMEKRA